MTILDFPTLSITLVFVSMMSFIVMFLIWHINRRLSGVRQWMLASLLIASAFLAIFIVNLLEFENGIDAFFSNAFSLPAVLLTVEGSLRFRGYHSPRRWRALLLTIPLLVLLAWINKENAQARYLFHDAISAVGLLFAGGIMVWHTETSEERRVNSLMAFSGALLSLAFTARWSFSMAAEPSELATDMPLNNALFFCLILFSIGWTYGVSLACYYRSHLQMMRMAQEDALTGLPNRRSIDDMLQRTLIESRRSGRAFGVIIIDLNNFKWINDRHGHSAGDELLVEVAARLRNYVRESDFAGRMGGDEFIVIAHNLETEAAPQRVLTRLRAAVEGPLAVSHEDYTVVVSTGMAVWPQDGDTIDELLRTADRRMYRDKQQASDTCRLVGDTDSSLMPSLHKS